MLVKGKSKSYKERFVTSMEIPEDLAFQEALLSVTGSTRLCIENYRSILKYTPCCVLVLTKNGRLLIQGRALEIQSYSNDEMIISGHISEINFQN